MITGWDDIDRMIKGGLKRGEMVIVLANSKPKSKAKDAVNREQKERFTLTLRDNKDLAFSKFVRILEEANVLFKMQTSASRIDRKGLVRDIIDAANSYIEAEDTLYKHKKELGLKTLTRYYNAIPDNFHGYVILNHLLPSYVTWKRERDISMINEMMKNK